MKINKKQIIESFLNITHHISDKSYQERIWIRREGPECQAFDDAVCDFFDIGDPILDNYKEFGITQNQQQVLKKFRERFREFSDKADLPEEFIDTPEWEDIMDRAKEVLKVLNYEKGHT